MKIIVKSAVLATVVASPLIHADEHEESRLEASGNVAFTTDYVFRGISRTNSRMSVQGGLDIGYVISDAATVYADTWASNVDFKNIDSGNQASAEFNAYAGVAGNILGVDWDLGGLGYIFPGEHDDDYAEVYGSRP
ncbi:MAG: TorF family putative porin [Methylococcales bacterium]